MTRFYRRQLPAGKGTTRETMDLLLAHGYFLREDSREQKVMKPYPPLGILYISAYLKSRGFAVGVFDSTFRRREDFEAVLAEEQPPVVGIYCNLMTKLNVLGMIGVARQHGAKVVLGGPEPPFYVDEYLSRGADVVVLGEGEKVMEELLESLSQRGPHRLSSVPGIAFRDEDGRVVRTRPRPMIRDLDEIPPPDRNAVDIEEYLRVWRDRHGYGAVSLICARGCPYHCDWCSHSVYGNTHRRRSPGNVADELEWLVDRYRPDRAWYADDVFTIKPSWVVAYSREIQRRGLRLPFECISRADRLNEEIVATLAEMGCYRLWIGSESGSQPILDAMRRGVKVEQVREMTRLLQRHGIEVGMFIMLGYDSEKEHDIVSTLLHLKAANPDIILTTIAYPIKGTGYYEKVKDRILARADWDARSDRDLTVAGRRSRRYYEAAIRWLTSEVTLHKQIDRRKRNLFIMIKSVLNLVRGRLGMALWDREVES